jgi:hypothetical protein
MVVDISVNADKDNSKLMLNYGMITMSYDTDDGEDFGRLCPACGIANPQEYQRCMMCDKDLTLTVLFIEDDFFDMELTKTELIEYRKNYFRTRRTGKIQHFQLDKMEDIDFESPVKRLSFNYNGKREVYPLKDENYRLLKLKLVEQVK